MITDALYFKNFNSSTCVKRFSSLRSRTNKVSFRVNTSCVQIQNGSYHPHHLKEYHQGRRICRGGSQRVEDAGTCGHVDEDEEKAVKQARDDCATVYNPLPARKQAINHNGCTGIPRAMNEMMVEESFFNPVVVRSCHFFRFSSRSW
jgi:hypothetical protein